MFLGEPGFDGFDREQYSFGYVFDHRFNDLWSISQNLRYSHAGTPEKFSLPMFDVSFLDDHRTMDRRAWDDRNHISVFSVDNQLQGKLSSGPLQHSLLLSVDYWYASNDWQFNSSEIKSIDGFAPHYGTPIGPYTFHRPGAAGAADGQLRTGPYSLAFFRNHSQKRVEFLVAIFSELPRRIGTVHQRRAVPQMVQLC